MTEIKEINEINQAPLRYAVDSRIEVYDERRARFIAVPKRRITRVRADVSERWVANVLIPEALCRNLVEAPFLEPQLYQGHAVLSLCAIFMRHAAPSWAPLALGPSSHNCALRIACIDKRDGSQAVWVDHRYTDSPFATLMSVLGFPPIFPYLHMHRWEADEGQGDNAALILDCPAAALRLALDSGHPPRRASIFAELNDFAQYFSAGVRSYGPGRGDDFAVVELHKQGSPVYEDLLHWRGVLDTAMGRWHCDSIYRTCNNIYDWEFHGYCNFRGDIIA